MLAQWAEVTIHRAEGSQGFKEQGAVETVTRLCPELQADVLPCPAGGMRGVERRVRGATQGRERPGTFQEAQKGSKRKS